MTGLVWEQKSSGPIRQYVAHGNRESYCITNERDAGQNVPHHQSYAVAIMSGGGRLLGEASTLDDAKNLAEAYDAGR
jgi:hypothetical protein